MATNDQQNGSNLEGLKADIEAELDHTQRELNEIEIMVEQSQLEVEKQVQRNATVTTHLQQIQAQFDTMPRPDIRSTYDAALESQQRLFVMRGQLEKLTSDLEHLKRLRSMQQQLLDLIASGLPGPSQGQPKTKSSTMEKLETIIQAQEAERQRLSQQIHDGPAQALSNFILQTEIAMRLFDIDQAKAREELANLKLSATSTFQKVRDFIAQLRPMMLDDLGLVPTLKRYVESFKEQSKMDIRLNVMGTEARFESYLEVMIFRSVQELLSNIASHSQATQSRILLDIGDTSIRVSVEDNGRGFDTASLEDRAGVGIKLIKDRVEMLGGDFEVESKAGQGTRVVFQVPASRIASAG
jgi:two-component system sensor histidine kinase DegS